MRPNSVTDPVDGQKYWCITQPDRNGRTYLVTLPWEGIYQSGYLTYISNPEASIKPSSSNIFVSREDAISAIEYDWNNPSAMIINDCVISRDLFNRIDEAFEEAILNDDLVTIVFDAKTQQEFLAALALSMGMQLSPRMDVDEPSRSE